MRDRTCRDPGLAYTLLQASCLCVVILHLSCDLAKIFEIVAKLGRVGVWRGGVRPSMSVSAPFVWRCLSGSTVAPFPHPSHRTGHADRPHPALGQDLTPSSTARRAQAGLDVRARSARRGARVDSSRPFVA